jgi:Holliday junction resolvase
MHKKCRRINNYDRRSKKSKKRIPAQMAQREPGEDQSAAGKILGKESGPGCPGQDHGAGNSMSKTAQRKGAAGEKELAAILNYYGFQTERGGSQTFGTVPDLIGLLGIHIECKRQERLNVPAAMQQAERDSDKFHDGKPAVFHRRNRGPWYVTMRLSDWIQLYKAAQGARKP